MAHIEFSLTDNSDLVLKAADEQIEAALEAIGNNAVSHAKNIIKAASRIDTGAMRDSVSHVTWAEGKELYVGTNQSYAIYHEIGTGIHLDGGGGRNTPWTFEDQSPRRRGTRHWTSGIKPIHFIRNSIADHLDEYREILKRYLSR